MSAPDNHELAVIIPTRGRVSKLRACLGRLAAQDLRPESGWEVLVVLDGPDPESDACAREFAKADSRGTGSERHRLNLRVVQGPGTGLSTTKNLGIRSTNARIVLFINDDVLPTAGFIRAHVEAHREGRIGPAMVLGHSPWVVHEPDTLFDRLIRETSMIFFYDQMISPTGEVKRPADHDWGFRHAWNINLSIPRESVLSVGGFSESITSYGYEDLELAWRLSKRLGGAGLPVLFRPAARAHHDHRYTPKAYLEREFHLGRCALPFAKAHPGCARDIFGRDLTSAAEIEYARQFVEHESWAETRLRDGYDALERVPASTVDGPWVARITSSLLSELMWLKRLQFRRGFLEAVRAEAESTSRAA
ncbi:MAG TPA: glycosyltransferase [Phycisphaerales bacterium]|nr:glycosyltransferase [Phycisphaerales bacterium]